MLRRLAAVLAGALVAATLAVSSATPASAQQACTGQGVAVTGAALVYVGVGPAVVNASFSFSLDVGICLPGGSLSANGRVNGNCGLSNGFGTTNAGANFTFTGIGTTLIITGDITGVVNATPDVLTGQSCLSGATRFLITGGGIDA